jgi:hypothetical protein
MVPLLAPLLGSLAGSLLPASVGTGIAGALGLKGATAGLVAAAAPKAIGAGIGTLLAGGNLGDAALNAVGFGAGGALTSQLRGAGMQNAGAAMPTPAPQPMGGQPRPQPMGAMGAAQPPLSASMQPQTSIPSVGADASGIASLPAMGQQPMSSNMMMANMGPDQSNMVNQYLRSQNMVGFV